MINGFAAEIALIGPQQRLCLLQCWFQIHSTFEWFQSLSSQINMSYFRWTVPHLSILPREHTKDLMSALRGARTTTPASSVQCLRGSCFRISRLTGQSVLCNSKGFLFLLTNTVTKKVLQESITHDTKRQGLVLYKYSQSFVKRIWIIFKFESPYWYGKESTGQRVLSIKQWHITSPSLYYLWV